jgi:hypothetical protein
MTLDEAIKYCEEVAEDQNKLCERCDRASGYFRSHNEAIRTDDAKKHEKCSQDFRQLAEWIKELKALKAEPCEDAISREDAMFLILHYGNEIRHEVMDDIKASMIKLPSVTHARPKGHWIREFDDIEGEVRFTCSNCRKHQLFETDFCYHCGSDNRKEEE